MKRYTMQAGTTFGESDKGQWLLRSEAAAEMVTVLRDAIAVNEAKDRLLIAYRTGGRTPEKSLDTLAKHNANPPHVRLAALIAALEAP